MIKESMSLTYSRVNLSESTSSTLCCSANCLLFKDSTRALNFICFRCQVCLEKSGSIGCGIRDQVVELQEASCHIIIDAA